MLEYTIEDNSGIIKAAKDEAIQRALEGVGIHLANEASDELENKPRRVDTARLKNSITHFVDVGEKTLYVGTNVEYAPYVHEGTRRMEPNRFLKNAFDENEDQVKDYIINELKKS